MSFIEANGVTILPITEWTDGVSPLIVLFSLPPEDYNGKGKKERDLSIPNSELVALAPGMLNIVSGACDGDSFDLKLDARRELYEEAGVQVASDALIRRFGYEASIEQERQDYEHLIHFFTHGFELPVSERLLDLFAKKMFLEKRLVYVMSAQEALNKPLRPIAQAVLKSNLRMRA